MTYTLENRPDDLTEYRKTATVFLLWVAEPFEIMTQEGCIGFGPDDCDNWDGGYFVAYPSDGSKPYGISKSFAEKNYITA